MIKTNNRVTIFPFFLLLFLGMKPFFAEACTAFFSGGANVYLAKNFDWSSGNGYLIKNLPGKLKYSYGLRQTEPARWISKYGSVTFNQIGKEFPYGGMNEMGLVVEQLWMQDAIYQDNKNKAVSELEWIQYQLDNYQSVDEVLSQIHSLTIKPIATVHFIIADKKGNSAVIDFVDGKTIISRNGGPIQVITNETLLNSEKYFNIKRSNIDQNSRSHFDRYCQVKNNLAGIPVQNTSTTFQILSYSAENRDNYKTYWSIVYDLSNLTISFRTIDNASIKNISLSSLNFNPGGATEGMNVNSDQVDFQLYSNEINKTLFTSSMRMMGLNVDEELGNAHQINPSQYRIDSVYLKNYIDLSLKFSSRILAGNIYYTIMSGEENFRKRAGIKRGVLAVNKVENLKVIYGLPKGEYAVASFQDSNLDGKIDSRIFGIPKNFGFSRNKRGIFGTPPSYDDAKLSLHSDSELLIVLK